jgi:hypothetical protein
MENKFYSKYAVPAKTSAVEARLAEEQFLLDKLILYTEKFLLYRAGARKPTVSKRK